MRLKFPESRHHEASVQLFVGACVARPLTAC
jgi:hypothetical protein